MTPDIAVQNGRVFVSRSGRFEDRDVLITDERIVAVPADATPRVDSETTIINACGRPVVPGFIDVHTHLDSMQAVESAYPAMLASGTTTVVSELNRWGHLQGVCGIREFLRATDSLPLTVLGTIPPSLFYDCFDLCATPDAVSDVLDLLEHDRVAGVGEVRWSFLTEHEPSAALKTLIAGGREQGKPVWGHGSGCPERKLATFRSFVDNDHEAITGEEVLARARYGFDIIGRYGATRDDIPALSKAAADADLRGVALCSDVLWPGHLQSEGQMDAVVRRCIAEGFTPAEAIRMATANAARLVGCPERGEIAPGQIADIVLLEDLKTIEVMTVISGGDLVVSGGEPVVPPVTYEYPDQFFDTIEIQLGEELFSIPADSAPAGDVRAIKHRQGLVTEETTIQPSECAGEYIAESSRDIAKVSLVDRHPVHDRGSFTGFVEGLSVQQGAVATSDPWGVSGVLTVGTSDTAMRAAVERVVSMHGGWAVVNEDGESTSLALPLLGVSARESVADLAREMDSIRCALRKLGVANESPLLAIAGLTAVGVPALKVSFSGYADVIEGRVRGMQSGTFED